MNTELKMCLFVPPVPSFFLSLSPSLFLSLSRSLSFRKVCCLYRIKQCFDPQGYCIACTTCCFYSVLAIQNKYYRINSVYDSSFCWWSWGEYHSKIEWKRDKKCMISHCCLFAFVHDRLSRVPSKMHHPVGKKTDLLPYILCQYLSINSFSSSSQLSRYITWQIQCLIWIWFVC